MATETVSDLWKAASAGRNLAAGSSGPVSLYDTQMAQEMFDRMLYRVLADQSWEAAQAEERKQRHAVELEQTKQAGTLAQEKEKTAASTKAHEIMQPADRKVLDLLEQIHGKEKAAKLFEEYKNKLQVEQIRADERRREAELKAGTGHEANAIKLMDTAIRMGLVDAKDTAGQAALMGLLKQMGTLTAGQAGGLLDINKKAGAGEKPTEAKPAEEAARPIRKEMRGGQLWLTNQPEDTTPMPTRATREGISPMAQDLAQAVTATQRPSPREVPNFPVAAPPPLQTEGNPIALILRLLTESGRPGNAELPPMPAF